MGRGAAVWAKLASPCALEVRRVSCAVGRTDLIPWRPPLGFVPLVLIRRSLLLLPSFARLLFVLFCFVFFAPFFVVRPFAKCFVISLLWPRVGLCDDLDTGYRIIVIAEGAK